jgi:hypothetical protein
MNNFDVKVRYRVYYMGTQCPSVFLYTDTYEFIDEAIDYLKYL